MKTKELRASCSLQCRLKDTQIGDSQNILHEQSLEMVIAKIRRGKVK